MDESQLFDLVQRIATLERKTAIMGTIQEQINTQLQCDNTLVSRCLFYMSIVCAVNSVVTMFLALFVLRLIFERR